MIVYLMIHTYGISFQALKLLFSYLTNRKQRVEIKIFSGDWFEIIVGVPQASVLSSTFCLMIYYYVQKMTISAILQITKRSTDVKDR